MGNANLLGPVALLAIIVFSIRFAAGAPRRTLLGAWIGAVGLPVLPRVVRDRICRGDRGRHRARHGAAHAPRAPAGRAHPVLHRLRGHRARRSAGVLAAARSPLHGARPQLRPHRPRADLAGGARARRAAAADRLGILDAVDRRRDPAFDEWIIDHGQTVMQAHNMWVDVFLQLGLIGVFLMGVLYLAFVWRSWFFAVDRPRWDLRADRPYSPLTLLPTLVGADPARAGTSRSPARCCCGAGCSWSCSRSRSSSRRTSARAPPRCASRSSVAS